MEDDERAERHGNRFSTPCTSRQSARSPSRRRIPTSSTSAPATSPAGRSRPAKASTSPLTPGRHGRTSASRTRNTSAASSSIREMPTRVLVAVLGPRAPAAAARRKVSADRRPSAACTDRRTAARTWTRVLPTDGSSGASDVYMDYRDPQMFALLAAGAGAGSGRPAGYRSTDGGATWQPVGAPRPAGGARISALAVASGTQRPAVVCRRRDGGRARRCGGRGLYRSDDGGETWTLGTRQLASAGGKMYADPQNPDVVYLMGTAIYRSTDGGQHVAAFWGAPSGADPRFLWIDPTNSKPHDRRRRSGRRRSPWTAARRSRRTTGWSTASSIACPPTTTFPITSADRSRIPAPPASPSRSDFGEIRPNDWYHGRRIRERIPHRRSARQALHVHAGLVSRAAPLRSRRPARSSCCISRRPRIVSAARRRSRSRRGCAHALHGGAARAGVGRSRADVAASSVPISRALPGVRPAPLAAPGGSRRRRRRAAADRSSRSRSSPVDAGVHLGGHQQRTRSRSTRDGGKTWTNVTPPNLPPGGINVIDASHAKAGTAYVALLSRDGHPHIYRTSRLRRELAGDLERACRRRGRPRHP